MAASLPPASSNQKPQEAPQPPSESPKLATLVEQLSDADEKRREAAIDELRALTKAGLSKSDGLYLLKASGNEYPPHKFGFASIQGDLIQAAASAAPDVSYVPIIREIFPRLRVTETQLVFDPRVAALRLLAFIDDRSAALALVELFESAVASGTLLELRLPQLEDKPRFADVYFPRLLGSAKGKATRGVFLLCLAYAEEGVLKPAELAPHAKVLVDAYQPMRAKVTATPVGNGIAWMWDEGYSEVRSEAGLVLDLMGYFPSADVEALLTEATQFKDPRLAQFAATSLLRLGHGVEARIVERVAASPEVRSMLFDRLKKQGRLGLFPAKWATQKALAESEMVRWLTFPSELGRAPDQIELMKVVTEDVGPPHGVLEWYLFRFRTHPPHWAAKDGWLAGVAGPFKKADAPSTTGYGDTFSNFTPWHGRTPQEHVNDIRQLIADWRERVPPN